MDGPKHSHPDTPITNKIIADADACPETRIRFLIKTLVNKCREFERAQAPVSEHIYTKADMGAACQLVIAANKKTAAMVVRGSLHEAAKDLHDYLRANVPDIIDISTSSQFAGHGVTVRLQALHDALKVVAATDMPLPLIAGELRSISYELAESDSDAWRSNISMLRDIAGDLEARSESTAPSGPYSVGEPDGEDGSSTVENRHGEPMTADEVVSELNGLHSALLKATGQEDIRKAIASALREPDWP